MDNSTVSFKKSATNYGLIFGAILAGITAILYAVSLETLTKWWLGFLIFFMALGMGIVSVAKSKSLLGGFISFKDAFTSYFITIAIGLLISVVVSIVIFNLVDPGAAEYLNEQIIEVTRDMMRSFGAPETEIDKALAEMEGKNNYAIGNLIQGFFIQLAFYSVFGLLIALIMKKKNPNELA
ncbi:MAG: DUF4199 domain-containing protein [Flavobacteriaceae bacterium]|nr:DUF4199 domain-containing protein [Flavobacteriaceae bacterium]